MLSISGSSTSSDGYDCYDSDPYTTVTTWTLQVVLSIMWFIHILLYVFISPPPTLFLNSLFIEMDNTFQLFGVVSYGAFAFYLLFVSPNTA